MISTCSGHVQISRTPPQAIAQRFSALALFAPLRSMPERRGWVKNGHDAGGGETSLMTDGIEKGLRTSPNSDSADSAGYELGGGDDGAAKRAMESVLSISAR
jgi:hypothetical protein